MTSFFFKMEDDLKLFSKLKTTSTISEMETTKRISKMEDNLKQNKNYLKQSKVNTMVVALLQVT
jgi:hypothetical protein